MAKTRVGVMLRESMGSSKSMNRSTDLAKLTKDYEKWCQQIAVLIEALKHHLNSLQQVTVSRAKVAKSLANFAKETPLFDAVGLLPSEDRPASTVCSYASVHDELGAKTKSYCGKYQQFVLDYAVEWEKVIRTRIDNGLKKAEELRRDLDHYQKKVEALRLSNNQAMAKGKSVPAGTQEKLGRNEEKLIQAKQNYNKVTTDLVILMEEVTERSWRDLHPLIIKCAQFDMTLSGDESTALAALSRVVDALKVVANDKGISAQPRLKDLGSLKPELISTRPGGVAGLQIEYGGGASSPTEGGGGPIVIPGGNLGQTAFAPGSVGPQGLGGFPVQMPPSGVPRAASFNSAHSAPTYPDMNRLTLSTNPAPAPTMDDIYQSQYNPSNIQSAPNSNGFNASAITPMNNWNPSYRSVSFNDADSSAYSGYSGYSAPPAAAPPLPPSMPPPPPPSSGGYDGLPPMAPISTSTSLTLSTLDPYSPANASQSSYGSQMQQPQSSPWAANNGPTTPTVSGSIYSPNSVSGGLQPFPGSNGASYGSQQRPPANQGYNPFG